MIIAHEMAHMWFGDLVTMRWWDDLWLNESFAEYMGSLTRRRGAALRATLDQLLRRASRPGVIRQDQRPSTHPIAADVADTAMALLNFDGISYAKGASALDQLVAWLGYDVFMSGVRGHFDGARVSERDPRRPTRRARRPVARDLAAWSRVWLAPAGSTRAAAGGRRRRTATVRAGGGRSDGARRSPDAAVASHRDRPLRRRRRRARLSRPGRGRCGRCADRVPALPARQACRTCSSSTTAT